MAEHKSKKIVWKKNFDYIFSLVGLMVGLGNLWRFPYLCFKNGGGAFLIAYWAFLIFMIFPMVIFECAMGQMSGFSPIKAWNIVPLFKGLGYTTPFFVIYISIFYAVMLSWILRWLWASFSSEMPWMTCDNIWNSNSCYPLFQMNITNETAMSGNASVVHSANQTGLTMSIEEFWRDNILGMTSGIEDLGGLKPDLVLCLVIIWLMTYFSIWKGIGWTSKIVYVTATTPFAMLIVVLVRGTTLEGSATGIEQYLKPNITKLGEFQVWGDAASQVLYSFGTCTGSIIALSSYNKYHHNFFKDMVILVLANAAASFLAGFAIFSVLGHLAQVKGTTIDEVADSGPGLVFVVYPAAVSLLPLPQIWLSLFFCTLLFVGFDSMFVYLEVFVACWREMWPQLFRKKWANEIQLALWLTGLCLFGLLTVTRGGIYVMEIFNRYSMSGWCLYFIALMESVCIGWIYGADKICDEIKVMIGFEVPRMYLKACWKVITPAISLVLLVYSLVLYEPFKYNDYVYPIWAEVVGWMVALSTMLCVPVTAGYVLWKTKGSSVAEKFRGSIQSTINKGKSQGRDKGNEMNLLGDSKTPHV